MPSPTTIDIRTVTNSKVLRCVFSELTCALSWKDRNGSLSAFQCKFSSMAGFERKADIQPGGTSAFSATSHSIRLNSGKSMCVYRPETAIQTRKKKPRHNDGALPSCSIKIPFIVRARQTHPPSRSKNRACRPSPDAAPCIRLRRDAKRIGLRKPGRAVQAPSESRQVRAGSGSP